jgi:tyrosyl-tRNA synthetase
MEANSNNGADTDKHGNSDAQENDDIFNFVTRDLEEVLGDVARLKARLTNKSDPQQQPASRPLTLYWGTAPTGKPHLGYFVPIMKLGDFLAAGCRVTILIADLHALLDCRKTDEQLVEARARWYEVVVRAMLAHVGVPVDQLEFVRGSSYQLASAYTMDVYRLMAQTTTRAAQNAAAEVVKMDKSPRISNVVYPLMQALDEVHLGVDAQFGGRDQRKIFAFARDHVLGGAAWHFVNPLVPGLIKGGKMSASDPRSKIDFDDDNDAIRAKIGAAYSVDGEAKGNGLLAILRHILWRRLAGPFVVDRPEQYGGPLSFDAYSEVEVAFATGALGSVDLKPAVAEALIEFLRPLRAALAEHGELLRQAYPDMAAS